MNIQEELRISMHQRVVGCAGTDEARVFQYWLKKYGYRDIPYILSLVYNLGRVQGIRDERKMRRERGAKQK
ncbi:MAG: hypothetical protein ACLUN9_21460 [Enterocloster aldenensis]